MFELEVLIGKALCAIYGSAACAITVEEVAALNHEIFDDAMEFASFVALWPAKVILGLACAELSEVLSCSWDCVGEEFHLDTAKRLSA